MKKIKILSFALALITLMSCFTLVIPASAADEGYTTPPSNLPSDDLYHKIVFYHASDDLYYCISFDSAASAKTLNNEIVLTLCNTYDHYTYMGYTWDVSSSTWVCFTLGKVESEDNTYYPYRELIYSTVDGMIEAPEAPGEDLEEGYMTPPSDDIGNYIVFWQYDSLSCYVFDNNCDLVVYDNEFHLICKSSFESFSYAIYVWQNNAWAKIFPTYTDYKTSSSEEIIPYGEILYSSVDYEITAPEPEDPSPSEPEPEENKCGENLTYSLDESTGIFTVSGTGFMTDYDGGSSPWYGARSSIKTVVVENGVESIGDYAFYNSTSLIKVIIKDSLSFKSIGFKAFYYCTNLITLVYCGTEAEWEAVEKGDNWDSKTNVSIQYHDYQSGVCTACGEAYVSDEGYTTPPSNLPSDDLYHKIVFYDASDDLYYCISFDSAASAKTLNNEIVLTLRNTYDHYTYMGYTWDVSSSTWVCFTLGKIESEDNTYYPYRELIYSTVDGMLEAPKAPSTFPVDTFLNKIICRVGNTYSCISFDDGAVASTAAWSITLYLKESYSSYSYRKFEWDPDSETWENATLKQYGEDCITMSTGISFSYDELVDSIVESGSEDGYLTPPLDNFENKIIVLLNGTYYCISADACCSLKADGFDVILTRIKSYDTYSYVLYMWDEDSLSWDEGIDMEQEDTNYFAYNEIIFTNVDGLEFDTSNYTGVLKDLGKDPSFKLSDYPTKADDYALDVIQIAEGKDGELFVYVYNPSDAYVDVRASHINMSLQHYEDKNPKYDLYKLMLVSSEGTLDKYVVADFKISKDETRYYNIAAVYTPYNDAIHKPADQADDVINYVGLPVGKCFAAYINANGKLAYDCVKVDVVEVNITSTGTIRYDKGISHLFWSNKLDSHFVAFNVVNYDVTRIFDASIKYTLYDHNIERETQTNKVTKDEKINYRTITDDIYEYEYGEVVRQGPFGRDYSWKRIMTLEEFHDMVENNANEKIIFDEENINKSQFVFLFLETDYDIENGWYGSPGESGTCCEEVAILRLHFATPEGTYNLGVVSDIVSDDGEPDIEIDAGDNVQNNFEDWLKKLEEKMGKLAEIIGILIAVVAIVAVIAVCTPVLSIVGKGFAALLGFIGSLITAPFRALSKSNRRKRK